MIVALPLATVELSFFPIGILARWDQVRGLALGRGGKAVFEGGNGGFFCACGAGLNLLNSCELSLFWASSKDPGSGEMSKSGNPSASFSGRVGGGVEEFWLDAIMANSIACLRSMPGKASFTFSYATMSATTSILELPNPGTTPG